MARQLIDTIAPGETIQSGGNKINAMTDELYRTANTTAVQWVSANGDNAEDGKTPATAKRNIANAVKALPIVNTGTSQQRHCGSVFVEPGFYLETDTPIPVHAGLQIIGMGNTFNGVTVQLANGQNSSLFSFRETSALTGESGSPPAYTEFSGGLLIRNMQINGNKGNNTAPTVGVIHLINGGYGCMLEDLHIYNGSGPGVMLKTRGLAFRMRNVNINACDGAAFDFLGTSSNILWTDSEIDHCGPHGAGSYAIRIRQDTSGNTWNTITFINLKLENGDASADQADSGIRFDPHVSASVAMNINVIGCSGLNADVPTANGAFIYESNATGAGANWNIIGCALSNAPTWANVFRSDKTGVIVPGPYSNFITSHNSGQHRINVGNVAILSGAGAPSMAANNGSKYYRTDGVGTTDNEYIRRGGAWVGVQ